MPYLGTVGSTTRTLAGTLYLRTRTFRVRRIHMRLPILAALRIILVRFLAVGRAARTLARAFHPFEAALGVRRVHMGCPLFVAHRVPLVSALAVLTVCNLGAFFEKS